MQYIVNMEDKIKYVSSLMLRKEIWSVEMWESFTI